MNDTPSGNKYYSAFLLDTIGSFLTWFVGRVSSQLEATEKDGEVILWRDDDVREQDFREWCTAHHIESVSRVSAPQDAVVGAVNDALELHLFKFKVDGLIRDIQEADYVVSHAGKISPHFYAPPLLHFHTTPHFKQPPKHQLYHISCVI